MGQRKTPVLLRRGPLSGDINAILKYTITGDVLKASEKQDVSFDFYYLVLEELFGGDDDCPDIVGILDGVADGQALTEWERTQVRNFRERFRAMVQKQNERVDAKKAAAVHPVEPDDEGMGTVATWTP